MNIGLDFDGVIIDWARLKSEGAKVLFGVHIPSDQISRDFVTSKGLLTHSQYDDLIEFIFQDDSIISSMRPLERALDYLHKLLSEKHNLRIITARSEQESANMNKWLQNNSLSLPVISTNRASKTEACNNLEIFVDDDYKKIIPILNSVPHPVLLTQWYNKHEKPQYPCTRVNSWEKLYALISTINKIH